MLDLVGNLEDRFSHDGAHLSFTPPRLPCIPPVILWRKILIGLLEEGYNCIFLAKIVNNVPYCDN